MELVSDKGGASVGSFGAKNILKHVNTNLGSELHEADSILILLSLVFFRLQTIWNASWLGYNISRLVWSVKAEWRKKKKSKIDTNWGIIILCLHSLQPPAYGGDMHHSMFSGTINTQLQS